jgi:hypothetical protein
MEMFSRNLRGQERAPTECELQDIPATNLHEDIKRNLSTLTKADTLKVLKTSGELRKNSLTRLLGARRKPCQKEDEPKAITSLGIIKPVLSEEKKLFFIKGVSNVAIKNYLSVFGQGNKLPLDFEQEALAYILEKIPGFPSKLSFTVRYLAEEGCF